VRLAHKLYPLTVDPSVDKLGRHWSVTVSWVLRDESGHGAYHPLISPVIISWVWILVMVFGLCRHTTSPPITIRNAYKWCTESEKPGSAQPICLQARKKEINLWIPSTSNSKKNLSEYFFELIHILERVD